jgi:GTP-binding protein YchF
MSLQIGIVGLPNVGKSTLFNALTKSQGAQAANYPFCTIDPNVGIVEVPDERLKNITTIAEPEKVIPTIIEFVDIAGLVKGASEGEGLGNQFLANIRQVDAIAHVVRVFEDEDVHHVHGEVNPASDREVIEMELILADLQTVTKRYEKAKSEARSGAKEKVIYLELITGLKAHLEAGEKAISYTDDPEKINQLKDLHLLTAKKFMYICNMLESEVADANPDELRSKLGLENNEPVIPVSAQVEQELISFDEEEAQEFLQELGLKESGLNAIIRTAYDLLGLQTYFTAGKTEVRAWTVRKGATAPQAAGVIHTDFEKGFIKAEVIAYQDYIECNGEAGAKEKGKLRLEGKDYLVQDGDVMHFKFNN